MSTVRTRLLLLALVVLCIQARATNYYLSSSSGDDSRTALQAQNPATPWKSIQKLNSFFASLQPGDSVLFKRGDTFYGSVEITRSGNAYASIVLSAYGTGAKPVITGFTPLTSWTSKGGGVYETTTTLPNAFLRMVTVNQQLQPMGRYPNSDAPDKGYLSFESALTSGSTVTAITDNELPSSPNWTGAEVVARLNHWVIGKSTIAAHLGSTLSFTSAIWGLTWPKFGYFIQNDIRTLDQVGEWYYNPLTKKLSMFFGAQSPSQFQVQAATVEDLVVSNRQSYVSVEGLSFRGSNDDAVAVTGGTGFSLRNSEVVYAGRNGFTATGSPTALRVEGCSFTHSNSNGIEVNGVNGVQLGAVLRANTIRHTGLNEGMLDITSKTGLGMNIGGDGYTIEQNTLDNTGNHGMIFSGNHILIKNNLIQNFNSVLDDGGGIYIIRGVTELGVNRTITGNIILNGIGALQGTDKSWVGSSGIYTDDKVHDLEVTGNTIANCVTTGVYVHNSSIITLRGNTLYNNGVQLILRHDNVAPDYPVRSLNVKQNIFFSPDPSQYVTDVRSIKDDLNLMGSLDSNYHCRPLNEDMVGYTAYVSGGKTIKNVFDLKGWQTASVHDKNSRITARQLSTYRWQGFSGTNRVSNGTMERDISGYYTNLPGTMSWVSGKLDGGTLQASVPATATNYSVSTVVGAITAGKRYLLRFSVQSERDTVLAVMLKSGSVHLTPARFVKMSPTRRDYEFLVEPATGGEKPSLTLATNAPGLRFWVDNLLLQEAEVSVQEPSSLTRLLYNASSVSKTVALEGRYVDVRNQSYSGSVSLAPYTSVVLLQDTSTVVARPNQAPTVSLTSPAAGSSFAAGASITVSASAQDADGSIAKVEFYNGSTLIGTATKSPYTITWNNVSSGNYTLKAIALDSDGLTGTSETVNVAVKMISPSASTCSATGSILQEVWNDVTGTSITSIPLSTAPASTNQLTSFEAPANGGDNYGQRVRGYICAPVSGQYTFYIASDDNSELWLSTSDDPQGRIRIASVSGWTAEQQWTKFASQKSVAITLEAGKKYYIEALHKEGTGGDNLAVGWQIPGSTSIEVIPGSVLSPFVVMSQPLSCSATGSILREVWNNITGTSITSIPLSTAPASTNQLTSFEAPANGGDNYGQRVRGYICAPVSGQYTFYIASDDNSELWLSTSDDPQGRIRIASVSGWTAERQWTKFASQKSVAITLEAGKKYYIEALHKEGTGGDNLAVGWQIPGSTSIEVIPGSVLSPFVVMSQPLSCSATGSILQEVWNNITGTSITSIPLSTAPASTNQLTSFEAPANGGDNYGQRVRGYICAPVSGQYTFYIASDDNSELWLSTSDDPQGRIRIASVSGWTAERQWTKFASQKSVAITLEAGKKYYIEALHKEGTGGDNLAVGWQIPGSTSIEVIPGSVLSPFVVSNQSLSARTTAGTVEVVEERNEVNNLSIKTYPNPSASYFNVTIQGTTAHPVSVNLVDLAGRVVERKTGISANTTIQLGGQLPRGLYVLQVIQGSQKKETKITKM